MATFDEVSGGIDSLININGFYTFSADAIQEGVGGFAGFGSGMIFFNDGGCSILQWKDKPPVFIFNKNTDLKSHLAEYEHRRFLLGKIFKWKHYQLCGGLYTLNHDTINVEYIAMESGKKHLIRYKFRVIDKKNILLISNSDIVKPEILKTMPAYDHDSFFPPDELDILKFVPAENLPSSVDMYNKHFKYRWRNKDKWREHNKLRRKQKKLK